MSLFPDSHAMKIYLAPMEGVLDHHLRTLLTNLGGIDGCVTEFVRISTPQCLPARVFHKICPELSNNCRTPSGIPVKIQLLGGEPQALAANAAMAVGLGADAIDLNFGCPAKSVNNSDGGASLLREPERIFKIVKAVRNCLPMKVSVTAKIRLGFEDRSLYLDNALAVANAGANAITVHARSKADGYKPPAYWDYIAHIREAINIPVIANGEIWSPEDFHRCKTISGCDNFMLGRGILARPDLALAMKAELNGQDYQAMAWEKVGFLLLNYFLTTKSLYPTRFTGNRIKQWLSYLRLQYPQADTLFESIKRERSADKIEFALQNQLETATTV